MKTALYLFFLAVSWPCFAGGYPVVREPNPFFGSRYYRPNDELSHPSVVMLHGSEGGSDMWIDAEANVLATQGYAVLVLCYFDCARFTGPRQTLKDVEATRVLDAVVWLRAQPHSNHKVAVYGFSRGAELTMVTGSLALTEANRPDLLIAHSPSDVFNGPWNWSWEDANCWICKAGSGKCTDPFPSSNYQWNSFCGPDDLGQLDPSKSSWLVNGASVPLITRIEIEKYGGPVLITVGEKDTMWPTDQTRRIEATLKAAGRPVEVHYFPNADHIFQGADELARKNLVLDFLSQLR